MENKKISTSEEAIVNQKRFFLSVIVMACCRPFEQALYFFVLVN